MNEHDLEKIIMRSKPDAESRPEFETDLRRRLLLELSSVKIRKSQPIFSMTRTFRIVLGGLAVAAVAAAVIVPFFMHRQGSGTIALLGTSTSVTQVGDDAFGPLNGLGTIDTGGNAGGSAKETATSPASSALAPVAASPMMSVMASGAETSGSAVSGSGTASPAIIVRPMPPLRFPAVTYVYKGDPIHQDQRKLNVLKSIPVALSADQITSVLAGLGGNAMSIPSFDGALVTNVTLSENSHFGYTINADLTAGTFSIYENYSEWPQDNGSPLTATEVPATDTIIGIADAFLADHGISTSTYAIPELTRQIGIVVPIVRPMAGAAAATSGSSAIASMPMIPYRPDSVEVLYPLTVNGMRVYSSSGAQIGLQVTVNLRYGKVSAVSGLAVTQYQSSAYDAITDSSTIISLAEHPSVYPIIYNGIMGVSSGATGATDINLGTPALAYEEVYQSDGKGGSSEFFVPAYVFPETTGPNAGTGSVIVPLVASFEQNSNGGGVMKPMPVPLEAPAVK